MSTTVILVHGAFAESSSWNAVAELLAGDERRIIAYANPLRGVATDAAGLTELVRSIDGPVVLVGHSYGGAVMTNVPADAGNVVGLVYVAGFALEAGESAADASGSVPGSSLAETVEPVALPGGGVDLYITQSKFHHQFCADVGEHESLMAITQRPVTEAALNEASGRTPLWKSVPSWFIFGDQDRNIPVAAHRNMAARASAIATKEIPGASHVVGVTHADETAELILQAVRARVPEASR